MGKVGSDRFYNFPEKMTFEQRLEELREQAMWIIWGEILVVREKSTKGLVGFKNIREASVAEMR